MKAISLRFKTGRRLMALAAGLLLAQTLPAAVSLTVTPSTVSNTYDGTVTLLVTGLSSGATVVVQKYLDLNSNGVIDANDWLVQQFTLTDDVGSPVIGGVTNFNVPGDTDSTAGQITAKLNFLNGDFIQTIAGQYLYKVSSTANGSATNKLVVTNYAVGQKFTGNVLSNGTSTVVSNAIVILISPGGNHQGPLAGVVADDAGSYTILAPAGTYGLAVFRSNYVSQFSSPPIVTLGSGQTVATNLTLDSATTNISGTMEDANSSVPLPGVFMTAKGPGGFQVVGATDSNGNFTLPVTTGEWSTGSEDSGLIVHGYLGLNNGTNVTAGQTGINLLVPQATALFYGKVTNNLGDPLAGVDILAEVDSSSNQYEMEGYSDTSGNYVTAVLGGLGSNAPWYMEVNNSSSFPDDVFSQPDFDTNGGSDIAAGTAVLVNFTATVTPYTISGKLTDNSGNPIGSVGVYAYGTATNGQNYNLNATTGTNGDYSIGVLGGSWNLGIQTGSGNGNLPNGYLPPTNQMVTVSNESVSNINFIAVIAPFTISGNLSDNNGNPIANVGIYANDETDPNYENINATTDGNGDYSIGVVSGSWQLGVNTCTNCGGSGNLPSDYILAQNLQNQTVAVSGGSVSNINFTALLAPYTITGNVKQAGGANIAGVGVLASDLGNTNYQSYVDTDGSGNYSLPVGSGNWNVSVNCFNCCDDLDNLLGSGTYVCPNGQFPTISDSGTNINFIVEPQSTGPLQITTSTLPGATQFVYYSTALLASGGEQPYAWSLTPGSSNLPAGLTLTNSGVILGTPTTNGSFNFSVRVTDFVGTVVDQPLSLAINPASPLEITTTSLPNGTDGVFYNQQLQASGGLLPYTWTNLAALPAGLRLATNGVLSGTPTTNGFFSFGVSVTDSAAEARNQTLSLTIALAPLQITSTSLTAATQDAFYTTTFSASGGQPPYTWSNSTALPAGLTLATNGVLSGTPTNSGSFPFTVTVTDGMSDTTNQALSLTVNSATPGELKVTILPTTAATAGAEWEVGTSGYQKSGVTVSNLAIGMQTVTFKTITGWNTPSNQTVLISSGVTTTAVENYTEKETPTLSVTSPKTPLTVSNAFLPMIGTTKDDVPIASVSWQLNGGSWMPALIGTSGTNWSTLVTLVPGSNTLHIYAEDTSGNLSKTNTLSIFYQVVAPITVVNVGFGKCSYTNGEELVIGKAYSITATADAGFKFSNWGGSFGTNSASLHFTMASNLIFYAYFVDSTKPTITVTAPSPTKLSNSVVTLSGTAKDNVSVLSVYYTMNSGADNHTVVTTNGYSNWTAVVILSPGTNDIQFYAEGTSDLISSPASVTLTDASAGFAPQSFSGAVVTLGSPASADLYLGMSTFAYVEGTNFETGNYTVTLSNADTAQIAYVDTAPPETNGGSGDLTLTFTSSTEGSYTNSNGEGGSFTLGGPAGEAFPSLDGAIVEGEGNFSGIFSNNYTNGTFIVSNQPAGTNGSGTYTYSLTSPQTALVTETFTNAGADGATNYVLLDYGGAGNDDFYSPPSSGTFAVTPSTTPKGFAPESIAGMLGSITLVQSEVVSGHTRTLTSTPMVSFGTATFARIDTADLSNDISGVGNYTYTRTGSNTADIAFYFTNPSEFSAFNGTEHFIFSSATTAAFTNGNVQAKLILSSHAATVPPSLLGSTLKFAPTTGSANTGIFGYNGVGSVISGGVTYPATYTFAPYGPDAAMMQSTFSGGTYSVTMWFTSGTSLTGSFVSFLKETGGGILVGEGKFAPTTP